MAIEFPCPHCTQLLRVADESAGKTAKCPKCSGLAKIPGGDAGINFAPPAGAPLGAPLPSNYSPPSGDFGGVGAPAKNPFSDAGAANPYSSQPKFGAPDININPYASPASGYQAPTSNVAIVPQVVGVEPIFSYSYQLWQDNLGLLIGITVTTIAITYVIAFMFGIPQFALEQNNEPEMAQLVGGLGNIVSNLVQLFLGIGETQIILKMARRQPTQYSDLFGGGSVFLPALGAGILFGIAFFFGILLLIVPGIILALMWWPYYYLVADKKAGVFESFSLASRVTQNNWGTACLLFLLSMGISILGCLACGIGILFAAPLVATMWGVAYLMMSGQIPALPASGQYKPTPQPAPQWPTS